jgi:TolB-like protein/Flp pilus assembly protein TadD
MEAPRTPTSEEIKAALERILASAPFANSHRGQQFLRHVVEGSLKDSDESLKEYSIAVDVFERDASYDPAVDATVRVEAGRLRSRLREYYADAGRNDPVLIEIPKGGYRATFAERPHMNGAGVLQAAPGSDLVTAPIPNDREGGSRPWTLPLSLAATAVLILAASFGLFEFLSARHRQVAPSRGAPIVLAVLPFSNLTGMDSNNYLTDGLTNNLIRQASELPNVRVISRAAVDGLNRQNAAKQLGVTVLLTGALQKGADGKVVLNSELSNAKDGTVLRSSQYILDEADLRPIQADIIQEVVTGLGIRLDEKSVAGALRPITSSPAAYQSFLRGESAFQNGDEDSVKAAIGLFQDAVAKDPSFAQAYGAMAAAELEISLFFEPPLERVDQARKFALRAIALDPSLAEAHGVLGLISLVFDWDFPKAQRELASADWRDNAIWQLGCTAHLLYLSRDTRRAEEDLHRILELNPGSVLFVTELGCVNYYAGRYDESIRYYRQVLASSPWAVLASWGLGRSLAGAHRYKEALDVLKKFNTTYGVEHPLILGEIGYIQAISGDHAAARETIQKLRTKSRKEWVDPYFTAEIYLALNDRPRTYAWLEKAYQDRSAFLVSIATDPKWSASLNDPHVQALWNKMTATSARAMRSANSSGSGGS